MTDFFGSRVDLCTPSPSVLGVADLKIMSPLLIPLIPLKRLAFNVPRVFLLCLILLFSLIPVLGMVSFPEFFPVSIVSGFVSPVFQLRAALLDVVLVIVSGTFFLTLFLCGGRFLADCG